MAANKVTAVRKGLRAIYSFETFREPPERQLRGSFSVALKR
jgi:hypothetical protein